ncbi:hypothetical protein AL346_15065 [Chelatococcus sp. CO-6]|nr:hypothetical protein AL346_15065 [Chelatococcus sp. CO-6]
MLRRRSDTQHSLGALVLAVLALAAGIVVVVESAWARRLPPAPAAAPSTRVRRRQARTPAVTWRRGRCGPACPDHHAMSDPADVRSG